MYEPLIHVPKRCQFCDYKSTFYQSDKKKTNNTENVSVILKLLARHLMIDYSKIGFIQVYFNGAVKRCWGVLVNEAISVSRENDHAVFNFTDARANYKEGRLQRNLFSRVNCMLWLRKITIHRTYGVCTFLGMRIYALHHDENCY